MITNQKPNKDFVREYFELITKEIKTDDSTLLSDEPVLKRSIQSLQERIERKQELLLSLEKESSTSLGNSQKNSFSEKAYFVLSELSLDIQKLVKFLSQYINTSSPSGKRTLFFSIAFIFLIFRFLFFRQVFIISLVISATIYSSAKLSSYEKKPDNRHEQEYLNKIKHHENDLEVLMKELKAKEIELEKIQNPPPDRKSLDLKTLEERVKELLSEDLWYLISEAKRESKVYDLDEDIYKSSNLESLEKEPIVSLVGISSKQEIDRADTPSTNLFKAEDFYSVVGLDGKRKYSIYEFAVIFLCSDFLCGYKSYWNLLEGVEAGGQSYKFPYDRIATIKTQEKSSLDMNEWDNFSVEKSENLENTRQQILSITTKDGDKLEFMMNNNSQAVIDSLSKRYVSDPNEAVQLIRLMLREN
ncbi:hypothetical protein IQ249_02285 [Lusitaniella coriacea LEGE 07157]|uniref:Uncharacterized protein n=1 Tax=Lusitaniella coriacea LEGE 07157 TaxID=945747 RepID=A0A8J7ARH2_9CYAN|nr:hypothetical protein [Lusitaniella coriacea]MBE9114716.1 hypothetical protein [Lusitaniella coriacea LEGE 07157]